MKILVPLASLVLALSGAAAQAPVSYTLSFPNAAHHEAVIVARFAELPPGPLEARMSRTSPGRYALHEFAKNVYGVEARDGAGRPLRVTRPDPHQWDVEGHDGTVEIRYTLYGDRVDGTYSAIDRTHAHLNAPATFLWARGLESRPVRVTLELPSAWSRISTQLVPSERPDVFTAPDFQYLMDSPIEISDHELRSWRAGRGADTATIRLAVHHQGTPEQVDAFAALVAQVVEEQRAVFGELPRFDFGSYTFLADYLPYADGDGMEHRNSTVLTSSRPLATGALRNLSTVSHEFFHAWNVERIRPRSLEPFDFEEANMSGELWFAEGFTSYYTPLIPTRAGIIPVDEYARGLAGPINTVTLSPGRRLFSPVEMSMQAPFVDAAVSVDPQNRENTFISYYTWGSALGLALDLSMRSRFPGRGLDDYMRAMWRSHGKPELPYTETDLERVLGEVTRDPGFAAVFFDRYVRGREAPDFAALLAPAGMVVRPAAPGRAFIGESVIQFRGGRAVIGGPTLVGTPLYEAGLDRGDVLLEVGGSPVTSPAALEALLAERRPGERVEVEFESRSGRMRRTLRIAENPFVEVVTFEAVGRPITREVRRFREAWLGTKVRR